MSKLSVQEQKDLDRAIKGLRYKLEALERGDLEMNPSIKNFIVDMCKILILLYEKTDL